jgi:U3 small nucleolar RNA-associated protein 14
MDKSEVFQGSGLREFVENDDLNNYTRELNNDMKLTKMNIHEKSLMVSSLRVKWLNYYFKEKENLQRIKKAKDKILKTKLGNGKVSTSVLKMKSEDVLSENDEQIRKLNSMNDRVKTNIEFLERAMNILNDFGFSVRNCIDLYKLEKM